MEIVEALTLTKTRRRPKEGRQQRAPLDSQGWEEAQRAEAKRLSQAKGKCPRAYKIKLSFRKVPSGPEMLYLIGWLYVNGAEQCLGMYLLA